MAAPETWRNVLPFLTTSSEERSFLSYTAIVAYKFKRFHYLQEMLFWHMI